MLTAAVTMVHRSGLTVSLDHISFEEVIREADVSRSAVYRRWPYKDLFISDLVKELARNATPGIVADELALMRRVLAEHLDWLATPELRHGLLIELIRQVSQLDFHYVYGSPGWRTYLALHATFLSLADGDLRDEVQAALAQSEQDRMTRIAAAWEQIAGLFGYRLRPDCGMAFATVAVLLTAGLHGLVLMALSAPGLAEQRVRARPFGALAEEDWSLPALATASKAWALLEPDPAIEWNSERVTRVRRELRELAAPEPG
jgi:AcrR family transcriptional regulator